MKVFSTLRPLGLAAAALLFAPAALADPPECSCRHIEALQNVYINARYLAGFQRELGEFLKEQEDILKNDPDRDSLIWSAREDFTAYNLNLPRTVPGYTGPAEVNMIPDTCRQKKEDLDAMEKGAPCRAIADAELEHEAAHRARCEAMGAKAYWDRPLSDIAFEEVEHYQRQAAKLKEELRRVLEFADVTYEDKWTLDVNAQGHAAFGYDYSAQSGDIGGATGGDVWTMTGDGSSTIVMTKAQIMGMACTASGALNTTYQVKMSTDGLTFDLELSDLVASGGLALSCPAGGGGGSPMGETAQVGEIASGLPVKAGKTPLPGNMVEQLRQRLAGAATVTGSGGGALMITCQGE